MILNALEGKSLPIYGKGDQIRDWLYVEDHARGIELVLNKGRVGENYNIGGNNEWANIDIVKTICGLMDNEFAKNSALATHFPKATAALAGKSESLITYVKDRPGHDRRYAIDATKTNDELGYAPKESFETGIKKTVQWYLENSEWCRHVQDGSYQRERLGVESVESKESK